MEFKQEKAALSRIDSDAVYLGIFQDELPEKVISRLDRHFPPSFIKQLGQVCQSERFKGKTGQLVQLPTYGQIRCGKLVLWGLGKLQEYNHGSVRKQAANVARQLSNSNGQTNACLYLRGNNRSEKHVQTAVEGCLLGSYSFKKYKSSKEDGQKSNLEFVSIGGVELTPGRFNRAAGAGRVIAEATNLARDLIAEPASYMTPTRLAQEARRAARASSLTFSVFDAGQLEKMGMGCLLGVARGAREPAKFIVMRYAAARAKKLLAIVGKGITFDSGGLSLKTAQGMEHMKYDMSGAAAVIATMQAMGKLKPAINLLGVIAATENMPGGAALHPGDVLVAMNGKSVEVNNTDAEGRLILADALCYACQQGPDQVIDLATLTGGCVTALGRVAAGIMGNDQELVDRLIAAGNEAGERLWQLPLFDEYKESLKSDIADLKNSGSRGEAVSSAGGMFLREFVDNKAWAHLDIAGPAWLDKDRDECNKGGTAFGVRLLCQYILSQR